jgi:2-methylcitrate dehydratase PrpD
MIGRTSCVHDKSMDARFPPDRPSRLTIKLNDGRVLAREIPYPKGDYRSPFSDEELAAKFRSLSASVLTPQQQQRAIACALNFSREGPASLIAACNPQAQSSGGAAGAGR